MEEKYYEPRPQKTRSTGRKAARIIGMAFRPPCGFLVWLWNGLMPGQDWASSTGRPSVWLFAKLLFGGFGHDFHDSGSFHDYAENGSNRESCHGL